MKKVLVLLLATLLLCPLMVSAESIDLSTMTREELHALIDQARAELSKFGLYADNDLVIFDEEGYKVTLSSYDYLRGAIELFFNMENNSDKALSLLIEKCFLNGHELDAGHEISLKAGESTREVTSVYDIEDIGIESEEDIETLEFSFKLYDVKTNDRIHKSEPIIIRFGY